MISVISHSSSDFEYIPTIVGYVGIQDANDKKPVSFPTHDVKTGS